MVEFSAEVRRFDLAKVSPKVTKTPQGFLKAPAFVTRAGVFEYRRADGKVVRELRPESEVFKQDSLSTIANAPITRDHPSDGYVTPDNAQKLSIGYLGEQVEKQDNKIGATAIIFDKNAINDVSAGVLREFSMGYKCQIEWTAGVDPKHGRYDCIQRNIRYNHAALGGKSWGRAGEEISLRLDKDDAVLVIEDDRPRGDSMNKPQRRVKPMDEQKVIIGGVEFSVPKNAAQAFEAELGRKDAKLEELQKASEQVQGRFDAKEDELKKAQAKIEELENSERFDSAVEARVALIAKARKVLGDDAEIAGSKREIMESVLKQDSDSNFSERSDDYVEARFDALVESWQDKKAKRSLAQNRKAADDATVSNTRLDADAARSKFIERSQQAHKRPLAFSKAQAQ